MRSYSTRGGSQGTSGSGPGVTSGYSKSAAGCSYIVWEGEINGKWRSSEFEMQHTLGEQMEMLEYAWRQRIHAMYRDANRLRQEASLENRKYRDYLRGKYNLQPVEFQ